MATNGGRRIEPAAYLALPLRAHTFVADSPLHDVWAVDLPGGVPDRTLEDLSEILSSQNLTNANPIVRALFGLRRTLGALFALDTPPEDAPPKESGPAPVTSWSDRLSDADRQRSSTPPGSSDGPFRVLYRFPEESLLEASNATVHAFLVYALVPSADGYTLYWAIYVRPVGRITPLYMALIDPFRRHIVYPAILRRVRSTWIERFA